MDEPRAVILMAYGSPQGPDEVARYLAHIRGGEEPSEAQVADLKRRYDAIGGRSPLLETTRAQAVAAERELRARGIEVPVLAAMKHSHPFIAEVVGQAVDGGAREVTGLALAPHFSRMSIGAYDEALKGAAAARGVRSRTVSNWHLEPALIAHWAEAIHAVRRARPEFAGARSMVLFSAHSLPVRIVEERDPYPDQLEETCQAVARAAGVGRWAFAWQSAGARGEWLGPPMEARLREFAADGVTAVISAPIGFVSDHLEVLYDLDIEARAQADRLGIRWCRLPAPNASPRLVEAVCDALSRVLVASRLASA